MSDTMTMAGCPVETSLNGNIIARPDTPEQLYNVTDLYHSTGKTITMVGPGCEIVLNGTKVSERFFLGINPSKRAITWAIVVSRKLQFSPWFYTTRGKNPALDSRHVVLSSSINGWGKWRIKQQGDRPCRRSPS